MTARPPCRCRSGHTSPTTCPVCGGAIRPYRSAGRRPGWLVDELLAARPLAGSIRTADDAYYDGLDGDGPHVDGFDGFDETDPGAGRDRRYGRVDDRSWT